MRHIVVIYTIYAAACNTSRYLLKAESDCDDNNMGKIRQNPKLLISLVYRQQQRWACCVIMKDTQERLWKNEPEKMEANVIQIRFGVLVSCKIFKNNNLKKSNQIKQISKIYGTFWFEFISRVRLVRGQIASLSPSAELKNNSYYIAPVKSQCRNYFHLCAVRLDTFLRFERITLLS